MSGDGVVDSDCVGDLDVDTSLTWAPAVDFLVSFQPLVFRLQLPGLLLLYGFSVDRNPCCKFANAVA